MQVSVESSLPLSKPGPGVDDSSRGSGGGRRQIFAFGRFQLEPANRLLTLDGREVPLPGRVFDLLLCLVQKPGELMTKEDLLDLVWEGAFVEESNLTVAISTLRRALDEDPQNRRYIQTVQRRGYRFIADVRLTETLQGATRVASPGTDRPGDQAVAAHAVMDRPEPKPASNVTAEETSVAVLEQNEAKHSTRWWPLVVLYAALIAVLGLGAWRLLKPRTTLHTLAVLPVTLADERSHAFGEIELLGMTDALVSRLEDKMVVRPTSSVLRYSAVNPVDPVAAGREQNVDAVLVGSLSVTGNQDTLRLQLVRVRDGITLWRNVFRAHGLNELQSAAGDAVVRELRHLGAAAPTKPLQPESQLARANNPAYDLYLRGRYFWNLRTEDGLRKAAASFREAIDADPNYAPAYAGLADSYALLASFSVEPGSLSNADARSAALSAIHLDPTLAEPHASLGMILFFTDWKVKAAEMEFERAIALNPNYATAHHWYSLDLGAMGRFPEALYEARLAEKLDPLSLIIDTNVGWIEYLAHDNAAATRDLQRSLELDPTFARTRTRLGMVELSEGHYADAVRDLKQALASSGDEDPYVEGLLGDAEAQSGDRADAEHLLQNLERRSASAYVPPISRALVLIGLGRRQQAIVALSQAIEDHSTSMVYAKVDPTLDPLRKEPAFQSLLTSVGN